MSDAGPEDAKRFRIRAAAPEMYEILDILAEHEHRWVSSDEWCERVLLKLHSVLGRIERWSIPPDNGDDK